MLNRLIITGNLNEQTPFCVVKEIISSHNISSTRLDEKDIKFFQLQTEIQKINSYRATTLFGSPEKNLRQIATFVNPDCKIWTKTSLLKAFDHLMNFDKLDSLKLSSITYSQKEPDNIEGYNACMLYGLCRKYNIETNWKMTGYQMANLLQKLVLDVNKLRSDLIPLLESLDKSQLLNIYSILEKKSGKDVSFVLQNPAPEVRPKDLSPMLILDSEKLKEIYRSFSDSKYLLLALKPKNHYEGIVLAGLLYNLNITESKFPLLEYEELMRVRNLDLYVPIDTIFRKRFFRNKSWYSLSHHWCSELSFLYSEKELKQFCISEGYSAEDFRSFDAITLLHMSRISVNIYPGKNVYNIEEDMTPISMHSITNLNNEECVTMGLLSEPNSLKTYVYSEFAEVFSNFKNYIHPEQTKECLPERVIKKLQTLATEKEVSCLLKAISIVEKWKQYSNEFSESLRVMYLKNPIVLEYLKKVMECGMYMRGWKVVSEIYPLTEEQTKLVNSDLQFQIEEKVFGSISEIQKWLDSNILQDEERTVLKNLPLMKFSHEGDTKIFVLSPDPEDGTSILHRLEIVLDGNKYKNMKSCIRLSSNLLLHSVYFYVCSLGLPEPFNIFELENIT